MKRGQVWIETVIYTLIGLSLIGLVLAFVTPKIQEYRDRSVIENTISSLNLIDEKINQVLQAPLNTRIVDFDLRRGELYVDAQNDSIYFVLEDSKVLYSESGEETSIGRITVLSEEGPKASRVTLFLNYQLDLNHSISEGVKKFSPAATPYRFSFQNTGISTRETDEGPENRVVVFFEELSGA